MDDPATCPSAQLTVSRGCETSRLQGQLLARAYQHIFPEVCRSVANPVLKSSATPPRVADVSTSARVAAGARI
jgi:hypothetical protein